jgi:hypothetical protein
VSKGFRAAGDIVCHAAIAREQLDHASGLSCGYLEEDAMRHITHPSKEQVRAYMLQRKAEHRPPPAPDQIRRQLGWSSCDDSYMNGCGTRALFFPVKIVELASLLAVEWFFSAGGYDRTH